MNVYHIMLIFIGSVGLFSGGTLFGIMWATVSFKNKLLIKLQGIVNNICDTICPNDCSNR